MISPDIKNVALVQPTQATSPQKVEWKERKVCSSDLPLALPFQGYAVREETSEPKKKARVDLSLRQEPTHIFSDTKSFFNYLLRDYAFKNSFLTPSILDYIEKNLEAMNRDEQESIRHLPKGLIELLIHPLPKTAYLFEFALIWSSHSLDPERIKIFTQKLLPLFSSIDDEKIYFACVQLLKEFISTSQGAIEQTIDKENLFARTLCAHALKELNRSYLALTQFQEVLKRDSRHFFALLGYASILFLTKNVNNAENYLLAAFKLNPKSPQAHIQYAQLLSYLKKYEKAEFLLSSALEIDFNIVTLIEHAKVLIELKKYEQACQELSIVLQYDPNHLEVQLKYGQAIIGLGLYQDALNLYTAILEQHPQDGEAHLGKGQALAGLGCHSDALGIFQAILDQHPQQLEARLQKAQILFANQEYLKALDEYKCILNVHPLHEEALIKKGGLLAILKDYQEAKEAYLLVLKINDKHIDVRFCLAQILYFLKEYKEAEEHYLLVLRDKPNEIKIRLKYAKTLVALQKYEKAGKQYLEVLKLDENYAKAYLGYADTLYFLKKYKQAKESYLDFFNKNRKRWDVFLKYAKTLFYLEEYQSAKEALLTLLNTLEQEASAARMSSPVQAPARDTRISPLNPLKLEALTIYAKTLLYLQEYEAARAKFVEALTINPKHSKALLGYALALFLLGHYQEADAIFLQAVQATNSIETYIKYAAFLLDVKRYDTAQTYFLKVLAIDKNNLQALFGMAQIAYDTQQVSAYHYIFRAYQSNDQQFVSNKGCLVLYAKILSQLGKVQEAQVQFTKALELPSANAIDEMNHVQCLLAIRKIDEAKIAIDKIGSKQLNYPTSIKYIELLIQVKAYKKALEHVEELLKLNPENFRALHLQMEIVC